MYSCPAELLLDIDELIDELLVIELLDCKLLDDDDCEPDKLLVDSTLCEDMELLLDEVEDTDETLLCDDSNGVDEELSSSSLSPSPPMGAPPKGHPIYTIT